MKRLALSSILTIPLIANAEVFKIKKIQASEKIPATSVEQKKQKVKK